MSGLHHVAIICSSKERALSFYKCLGFEVKSECPRPERNDEIIFLFGFGITLEIFVKTGQPERLSFPEAYGLRHIAFCVENVEAVCKKLKGAGYSPEPIRFDSITGEKMTFVPDPDGLPIELHE